MDGIQKSDSLYKPYEGVTHSESPSHQNKKYPVAQQNVKSYANGAKGGKSICSPTKTQRGISAISFIEQRGDCLKPEMQEAHENSALALTLIITQGVSMIMMIVTMVAIFIDIIVMLALLQFPAMLHPAGIVGFSLIGAFVFFGLIAGVFGRLTDLNNSAHSPILADLCVIRPMLDFIDKAKRKDKAFEDLLLGVKITGYGIKNITNTISEKQKKVVNQYEKFQAVSFKYRKLSKLIFNNTDTNSDKEKQIMQAKLLKAEQQELVAQDKFNFAVQELASSLINSICENFEADEETQKTIKLSLLKYCSNNQEAFKSIVKNTIPYEVKKNPEIKKVVDNAVDNAVGNILSNLRSF